MKRLLPEALELDNYFHRIISSQPIFPGASGRRFYRVALKDLGVAVLCDVSRVEHPERLIRHHVAITEIFRKRGINAPAIIDTDFRNWILFEDLGPDTLANLLRGRDELNVDQLFEMEILLNSISTISLTPEESQHVEIWEDSHVHQSWTSELRGNCRTLAREVKDVLSGFPHAVMHGDMQSRNVTWNDTKGPAVVDIQDATWAPYVIDLSLLCVDPNFDQVLLDPAIAVNLLEPSYRRRPRAKEELELGMFYQCFRLMHKCHSLWEDGFGESFLEESIRSRCKIFSNDFTECLRLYVSGDCLDILNGCECHDCT